MYTIKDVARRAGVGIATVSRMMNGTGYVSAETRERIERAIEELGYVPNERARNLSRKRTNIIGIIIPNFQTPYYSAFIRQVEKELYDYGYKTMICNTITESDREKEYLELLDRNLVDGIITCALSIDESFYQKSGKPIVSMDHDLGEGIPLIHSNHRKGGELAAELLLERGCRNVVILGSYFQANTPSNDRYEELERRITNAGGAVRNVEIAWNHRDYEYYRTELERQVEYLHWADAILASDMGAFAVHRFACEQGVRVPEDVKILAYDGTDMTRMRYPVMTAIRQDTDMLAHKCVDTIMKLIAGEDVEMHQVVNVEVQYGSTL